MKVLVKIKTWELLLHKSVKRIPICQIAYKTSFLFIWGPMTKTSFLLVWAPMARTKIDKVSIQNKKMRTSAVTMHLTYAYLVNLIEKYF